MMRSRRRVHTAAILFTVIGIMIALTLWLFPERVQRAVSLFSVESIELLVEVLRSLGWIGPLVSIGLMMVQSIIAPLPSFVIAAANGMVYGVFWGAVISWIGGMAGALLNFWLARRLGYGYVRKWAKKAEMLRRIDQLGGKNGFTVILIARLLPIVSFDAISLLAGLSSIRLGSFLLATGIGQIPGTLLYVILGHDLIQIDKYQNRLWVVAGILIGLILITKWASKIRDRKHLKKADDMTGIKELQTETTKVGTSLMNITIYTSDHCPSCKEAIRFFQEKGIPYRQLDVGYSRENFDEMLRLGGIATPFIVVDGKTFHSFDRGKLEGVLQNGHG
jgi:uncharacterized membrane protein YdjX (TVP38/TMEM64 family)/glutaredoxin